MRHQKQVSMVANSAGKYSRAVWVDGPVLPSANESYDSVVKVTSKEDGAAVTAATMSLSLSAAEMITGGSGSCLVLIAATSEEETRIAETKRAEEALLIGVYFACFAAMSLQVLTQLVVPESGPGKNRV